MRQGIFQKEKMHLPKVDTLMPYAVVLITANLVLHRSLSEAQTLLHRNLVLEQWFRIVYIWDTMPKFTRLKIYSYQNNDIHLIQEIVRLLEIIVDITWHSITSPCTCLRDIKYELINENRIVMRCSLMLHLPIQARLSSSYRSLKQFCIKYNLMNRTKI